MLETDIINAIKSEIAKRVEMEYTDYTVNCMKELRDKLESKRNQVITDVLNAIEIYVSETDPRTLSPTILIRVENKVVLKEDNK